MIDELSQHPPAALDLRDVQVWNVSWAQVERRIGSAFARADARTCAMAYLAGLLSPAERKNSWQLAEITDHPGQLHLNSNAFLMPFMVLWRVYPSFQAHLWTGLQGNRRPF